MDYSYDKYAEKKYIDLFWFEAQTEEDLYNCIWKTVKNIKEKQYSRTTKNLRNLRMYTNQITRNVFMADHNLKTTEELLSLNVVQSITDTVTSNIGKNTPKVTFLTDNGNYTLKQRAKKLDNFVQGQFAMTGLYSKAISTLKRACVFSDGFVKIYERDNNPYVEKTFNEEIIVDEREGEEPMSMYQLKFVSRFVLMKKYPEKATQIREIDYSAYKDIYQVAVDEFNFELVPVLEAWRLPTKKGSNDGRHSIILKNCVLEDGGWNKPYFPFVKIPFSSNVTGYYGIGVADLLCGMQYELNRVLRRIQQSIWIGAVPRVFFRYNSDINDEHFNNEVGTMVGYAGNTPPVVITPQVVGADVFGHLDRLYQRCYEIIGVSQMAAGGKKLEGLDSGEAIRTFRDIETARFSVVQKSYDDFHLECAYRIVDIGKDIGARDSSYGVMAESKTGEGASYIKWSEVNMEEDQYVMRMYPTNLLPSEPVGKLSTVIEMTSAGMLTKDEAISLIDFPDIKSIISLKNAKIDDILKTIFTMLDTGEYIPPEPLQDLMKGIEYCQAFYLKFRLQKVPENRLNLLDQWIKDAQKILIPPAQDEIIESQSMNQMQPGMEMQGMEPENMTGMEESGLGEQISLTQ